MGSGVTCDWGATLAADATHAYVRSEFGFLGEPAVFPIRFSRM